MAATPVTLVGTKSLVITNSLTQPIKISVSEAPGWKGLTMIEDAGAVTVTIGDLVAEISAMVAAGIAVPPLGVAEAVGGIGALLVSVNVARQMVMKLRRWTNKAVAAAEKVVNAFQSKQATVAAGATLQVMDSKAWTDLLTADAVGIMVKADTIGIVITTSKDAAGNIRMMHFPSRANANWNVSAEGAYDTINNVTYRWDGSLNPNSRRPAMASSADAVWLALRSPDDDGTMRLLRYQDGYWMAAPVPYGATGPYDPALAVQKGYAWLGSISTTQTANSILISTSGLSTALDTPGYNWGVGGSAPTSDAVFSKQVGTELGLTASDDTLCAAVCTAPGSAAFVMYALGDLNKLFVPGNQPFFTNRVALSGVETDHCPAMAWYKGKLYCAWTKNAGAAVGFSAFDDSGSAANADGVIPDAHSIVSPALAVLQGKLFAVWLKSDSQDFWCCAFDGTSWGTRNRVLDLYGGVRPDGTTQPMGPPALAATEDTLVLAWCGPTPSSGIQFYYTESSDGEDWGIFTEDGSRVPQRVMIPLFAPTSVPVA
jgi:hypothetical protein